MHEVLGESRKKDLSCKMNNILTYYGYISNKLKKDAILMLPTIWRLLVRGFFSRPSMSNIPLWNKNTASPFALF